MCSNIVTAQQSRIIQQQLNNSEQELTRLKTEQLQLIAAGSQIDSTLAPLLVSENPEKIQLDKTMAELAQSEENFNSNPSPENKAKLKNTKFKFALAERKFKKSNAHLFELQEKNQKNKEQLSANKKSISKLTTTIANQRKQLEQVKSQEFSQQQTRKVEEQKIEAEAAQAEIARLKAELEEQKLALKKAEEKTMTVTTTTVEKDSYEQKELPTSLAVDEVITTPQKPTRIEGINGITLLLSPEEVKSHEDMIANTLAQVRGKLYSSKKLRMHIKPATKNPTEVNNEDKKLILKPIAPGLFRGTISLDSGDTLFQLRSTEWRQVIPPTDSKDYTLYLDNSDKKNPKLTYYPQTLLVMPKN
jgi:DNA repair exonuclease SbcCD ATPase subunit